jgi:hypothetical protein
LLQHHERVPVQFWQRQHFILRTGGLHAPVWFFYCISSDTEYYVILQLNFQIEVQDRCQKSTDIWLPSTIPGT